MSYIAACIQMTSGDDVAANIAQLEPLMQDAIAKGAQFIALPENVFYMRREGTAGGGIYKTNDHPGVQWVQKIAAQHNVWVLIGSIRAEASAESKPMNRSVLVGPQGVSAIYDKVHLFDVTLPDGSHYRESAQAGYGTLPVLARTPLGSIGLSICYDLRFPHSYRELALAGAEILVVPSAFTRPTGEAHWHALLRARAIENGAFVIAPAQCGEHPGGRTTYGHSLIIDPWGSILAEAGDEQAVITATIDLEKVGEVRKQLPVLQHHKDIRSVKIV
ncbi:MAG: carbon-nitrogen hydrolase family protein [Alphaproteobacteria bacterium]|nr:carbon-nitrogen hydrolase family protein [Alphaproteobacteria bacterium]